MQDPGRETDGPGRVNDPEGAVAIVRDGAFALPDRAALPADGGPAFNRLIFSSSPYLLQHARNPVDWYPWGDEAFERAREEDLPVFLSIGYSSCHWCHVMERESFEDADIAAALRASFIAVKVDREERPDLDHLYMSACQALTGSGGWPLSLFLTPDRKPFFAGTYFPPDDRYGRPGFRRLLEAVASGWRRDRANILAAASDLLEHLARGMEAGTQDDGADRDAAPGLSPALLEAAERRILASFDAGHGGFGGAPKFPMGHLLSFLLRRHRRGAPAALRAAEITLGALRRGGIRDHVGGGFCRYATDERWRIPHFEKMLYDNALLAMAFTDAWQCTADPACADVARDTLAYALRTLRSPEGLFHSAEDADSEGEEGRFYTFTDAEFRAAAVGERAEALGGYAEALGGYAEALAEYFGVTPQGNFERGRSVLRIAVDEASWRQRHGLDEASAAALLAAARRRLFEARGRRVHPALDDKVLCSWNGLMIAALARAGQALNDRALTAAAARAADAALNRFLRADGGLMHRDWRGSTGIDGMLEDYAFLAWGLVELFQATFRVACLERAVALARRMIDEFGDEAGGAFFLSPRSQSDLLLRVKDEGDGAMPAANSVAAFVLLRLALMTADAAFDAAAHGILRAGAAAMASAPAGHAMLLAALDLAVGPSTQIVLAGPDAASVEPFARAARERYLPRAVMLFHPIGPDGDRLRALCGSIRHYPMRDGKPTAYVCRNFACDAPVTEPEAFLRALDAVSPAAAAPPATAAPPAASA